MKKNSAFAIILALSFVACARDRRATQKKPPRVPEPTAEPAMKLVDNDFYLVVMETNAPQERFTDENLRLEVQAVYQESSGSPTPKLDLFSGYYNEILPIFEGAKHGPESGGWHGEWETKNGTFDYRQTVKGNISQGELELAYYLKTVYTDGRPDKTYETKVSGFPRTLQNPATRDGVYMANWYHYGKTRKGALNCPWFNRPPSVSEAYRLDVYERPDRPRQFAVDHGELAFTLDALPKKDQSAHGAGKRVWLFGYEEPGEAWVQGVIEPSGVDITIKFYVPNVILDPDNPPDPEAPRCWYEYRVRSGPKRRFNGEEVDNYYRLRRRSWDQCNTWNPLNPPPPRVITEEVVDIVVNESENELKILDKQGQVTEFPLFFDNTFVLEKEEVYEGVGEVKTTYEGRFEPPYLYGSTTSVYPGGCVTYSEYSGRARYSF